MASQPSNFDAEIKQGMKGQQPKDAKSSTNAAPDKAPAAGGNFNAKPKPSAPQPQDTSANTHQAMLDAGQAHMAAIHAHINSMKGM
jgi:hypothetical protein